MKVERYTKWPSPGATLLRRTVKALERVINEDPEAMRHALEASTDAGGLAILAAAAAAVPAVAELDPAAQLLAEGARRKTELLDKANKGMGVGEVSKLLRIGRQAVNKRRKSGKLIAVPSGSDYLYPTCQFTPRGLLEGLERALRAMPIKDPWMRLEWLLTEDDVLNGQSPLEALKAGRVEEVIALAAGHGGE